MFFLPLSSYVSGWGFLIQAIQTLFDNVFSWLFTYLWIPDLFPSATTAIASAMSTFSPYFVALNSIFPLFLLFQVLGYMFIIEIFILILKISLIIIRLIRG